MTTERSEEDFVNELWAIVAQSLNTTPDALKAQQRAQQERRAARRESQNARYYAALDRITPQQAKVLADLRAQGARVWDKLRQHRESGNVCIFLSRSPVFNDAKGRMGTKLYAVYPDGTRTETFERSISVRAKF